MTVNMSLGQYLNYKYVIVTSGIGILTAYGFYRLYNYFNKDEYFVKMSWHGGISQRRILVLGLDGAGKTRLLQCFRQNIQPGDILPTPSPTIGINVLSAGISGIDYHFWDMAGNGRYYWKQFINNMDVLLWVVDSSNPLRLHESRRMLHQVVETIDKHDDVNKNGEVIKNTYGIPIVIVAAKQDKYKCLKPNTILEKMDVAEFQERHKIYVVGTEVPNTGVRQGLWRLYELISFANKKRWSNRPKHAIGL